MKKPPIDYCCTLTDAAKAIGVSQVRAQQIEASALQKLRWYLQHKGQDWDDLSTESAQAAPAFETAFTAMDRHSMEQHL